MVIDIGEVKRHIKPKADSTLRNMKKDELIAYIRTLEHNYNVAQTFLEQQAKNFESLVFPTGNEEGQIVIYDAKTREWFARNRDAETTVTRCEGCGLYYKPELGHNCLRRNYGNR